MSRHCCDDDSPPLRNHSSLARTTSSAVAKNAPLLPPRSDDGLLGSLSVLEAPGFDPSAVHPGIAEFYRHTRAFDLHIGSRWAGPFRAVGWLIARVFARRLAQLNVPLSEREVRGGVESRIVRLADADGRPRHTGWVRTSVETRHPVFVGEYGVATIPGHAGPCLRVVFPLPNGNAVVLLRPTVGDDGALWLVSDGRRFGDPGFYFTVAAGPGEVWARYLRTMKERLVLEVRDDVLFGRHHFAVFGLPFLELRYRIVRSAGTVH